MPHLTDLTIGTLFRGNDGEEYRVCSNFSEDKKMFIELEKVVSEPEDKLIPEI